MNVLNKVSQQKFHNKISVCLLQYLLQQFIILQVCKWNNKEKNKLIVFSIYVG